ncbi:MAG: hypothetical protein ACAF41_30525 [Leptolyngbya sp. BL-A-14]
MLARSNLKFFWLQWIIVNMISLAGGFSLPFSVPGLIKSFGGSSIVSLGIYSPDILMGITAATAMGTAQWLVLKNRILRLHPLWIATNIIGLLISAFITLCLGGLSSLSSAPSSFTQEIQGSFLYGILGGLVGGLLIGFAQSFVLMEWASWILVNGIAWSLAWGTALATTLVIDRLLYIRLNVDLSGSIQLIIFGSILGFISSLLTGTYLIYLLKRSDT